MMLSEALDKVVIAEGIETADQAWMLKMMGCKVGQGYHFGRPKTAAEMRGALVERAPAMRSRGLPTHHSPQSACKLGHRFI